MSLTVRIMIALVAGLVCGIALSEYGGALDARIVDIAQPVGKAWLNGLQMPLIPLIFALLVTGIPLSVSAAIGFIALFGQSVLNGVVMVTYFNQLREEGMSVREAVLTGSMDRLRTVLMTAMLAMLGLFPMAISRAIGSETQRPLAIVIIGGLITATLLTLIVLPTLYEWMVGRNWPDEEGSDDDNGDRLTPSISN